ncbi:hypothetical protein SDC9_87188 [bioreactor metagenome]|uniref:Uncharacterized protein n=1 Tax=bioreactor metagenome TaxID=1076179 RepID=A0A644ZSG6_9ZZZZ
MGGGALLRRDPVALLPPDREHRVGHQPPVRVVEVGGVVVAIEHGELGAVDRAELIARDAEHQRHQRVELDQRVTPILRPPQRRVRRPSGSDSSQCRSVRSIRPDDPRIAGEGRLVDVLPQLRKRVGEAIEPERTEEEFGAESLVRDGGEPVDNGLTDVGLWRRANREVAKNGGK